jgi:5'-deoxynucleotidase YfbR-like HD superfamily hydrolase
MAVGSSSIECLLFLYVTACVVLYMHDSLETLLTDIPVTWKPFNVLAVDLHQIIEEIIERMAKCRLYL